MSATTTQPPDLTAHLDAAERAGADFYEALRACLVAVPEGETYDGLRYNLGKCVEGAESAKRASGIVRAVLAEMARPKGPMVEIRYPSRHGGGPEPTGTAELEQITSAAFIMRGGKRYSRSKGTQIGHADRWVGTPYITEAERTRVLALPRPPTAAAKKAPK